MADDPTNMGVISSLLVLEPSLAEFNAIMSDIQSPEMQPLVSDAFDWPEMQYLTLRYSGQWTNVDLRYHSLNGYPNLDVLYGIHYTGFKPWQFRREGSMDRYGRRDDFQLWFKLYREMLQAHPRLQGNRKLDTLLQKINVFLGIVSRPPKAEPSQRRPSTPTPPKKKQTPRQKSSKKSRKNWRNGRS